MALAKTRFTAAEFFAGIGLVGQALAEAGGQVAWANDIDHIKAHLFGANFDGNVLTRGDVRSVRGHELPEVDVATASFPCTDLSLAGWRRGLSGRESGMFWEFARVLDEMEGRRPPVLLLENVPGFATSHGGSDLEAAVERLTGLGYSSDIFEIDARHFVPQSRPRLFIVASTQPLGARPVTVDSFRPGYVAGLASRRPDLRLHALTLPRLPAADHRFAELVERLPVDDARWWSPERVEGFLASMSARQADRAEELRDGPMAWRTAYRRTRRGVARWEMRDDEIAGCLRTAKGGSSKQAVVEAGDGALRVRWMTEVEYARLQGVDDTFDFAGLSPNKVMFGFGDAICVPVVSWIAEHYLVPALEAMPATA